MSHLQAKQLRSAHLRICCPFKTGKIRAVYFSCSRRRLPGLKRGERQLAISAPAQGSVSQREAVGAPEVALNEGQDQLDPNEGTRKESLILLEWPALCRQVAAFASTPMAAQRVLLSGLPIGRSRVRYTAAVLLQRANQKGFCCRVFNRLGYAQQQNPNEHRKRLPHQWSRM